MEINSVMCFVFLYSLHITKLNYKNKNSIYNVKNVTVKNQK